MEQDPPVEIRRSRGRPRLANSAIEAAVALIEESGVKGLTMEAIATRAGISKITLYRNWSSRGAILAEAYFIIVRKLLPLDGDGDPAATIIGHATRFGQELSGRSGGMMRDMIVEFVSDEALLRDFRERYLDLRRDVATSLIERGMKLGQFQASGDPRILHDSLYGAIFYRFLFGLGGLAPQDIRALVRSVLKPRK